MENASQAGPQRRFAVIGCGSIGKRHIGNLQALGAADIVGFDLRPDRRSETQSALGVEVVGSLDGLWDRRPDVAVVAVPTSLHVSVAIQAAEHGCHLLIEKPLSDSMTGVERLGELIQRHRLACLIGCNMRFLPGMQKIRELLQQEAVGHVVAVRAEAGQYLPDWHPWEDYRQTYSARRELGGGIILDAIHELDYLYYLLGEVESVACFAGKLSHLEIDTEDTAAILLRFADGALGEVHLDYVQRAYSRTCQIIGEQGTIHWQYTSGEVRWYSAADGQWHTFAQPAGWQVNHMYLEELRHFFACLEGAQQPLAGFEDGRRVLEIALAAKRSAEEGRVLALAASGKAKVVIIIQARMGATRLPGKTLLEIGNRPLLAHVIERARACRRAQQVVVATTTDPDDQPVDELAARLGCQVYRGSADDVLDRYYQAALQSGAGIVVRFTADDPFKDPTVTDQVIARLLSDPALDYASNTMEPTFPEGLDVEAFTFAALERAWREARLPAEREHVTPYLYNHPERFRLASVTSPRNLSHLRLTVDYEQDLRLAREICFRLGPGGRIFSLQEIVSLLEAEPTLAAINQGIERYAGYAASLRKQAASAPREGS